MPVSSESVEFVSKHEYFSKYATKVLDGVDHVDTVFDPIINEALDKTFTGEIKRLIINIPPGYGKCSHEDAIVLTRRGYIPAREVVVGDEFCSFTAGKAVWSKCLSLESFEKPCITIKTKTGREYTASYDHPIKTQRGWTKLQEIEVDQHCAVTFSSALEYGEAIPAAELDLVTLLLFEGGCSGYATKFTSADKEVVDVMRSACDDLGMTLNLSKNSEIDYSISGCRYVATATGRSDRGMPVAIARDVRSEYGIDGLAKNKQFPRQFDNLPLEQRWRFIGLMLATDGWITKSSNQFGVTIASKPIAEGCQRILASCGVPSSMYRKKNDHAGAWEVVVAAAYGEYVGKNVDALQKQHLFEGFSSKTRQSYVDAYPSELFGGGSRSRDIAAGIRTDSLKKQITRGRWAKIVAAYPEYADRTLEDFHYDGIKEKRAAGVQRVIHFEVEGTQNYVCSGIVTHNTAKAVWAYVARGFAINPTSRFIHASYSDKLVQDNSSKIRDLIGHKDYRTLFPYVNFKEDSKAKGLWKTDQGGSFLASPSGGSITGFRAGLVSSDYLFTGAFIVDDPLKPDDALSDTKRDFINQRWHGTFKSRLANPDVPVIVIMQRIHEEDFTWELLENSGEEWHHLVLPAYIEPGYEYKQSGIYIDHGLPEGTLWDMKASDRQALSLMDQIQYSQEPSPAKGEVYEREWFNRYTTLPDHIKSWTIYCDTASKTNKYNDYSVFQLWAQTVENKGYLVKQWHKKVKIPFLVDELEQFYRDAEKISGQRKIKISIEDKDSGQGLIQSLELLADDEGDRYEVVAIQRREGKYARAVKAAPHIKDGEIYIMTGPEGDGVITEATKFKADDSHKHDDRLDPMNDFINFELPDKLNIDRFDSSDLGVFMS